MIEATAGLVAILIGVITVLTTYSKLQALHSRLESSDQALTAKLSELALRLEHTNDRFDLGVNGLRERIEHINTRVSGQQREFGVTLTDVENYLQKNTPYERRSR